MSQNVITYDFSNVANILQWKYSQINSSTNTSIYLARLFVSGFFLIWMGVSAQLYYVQLDTIVYICPLVLYHIKARTFTSPSPHLFSSEYKCLSGSIEEFTILIKVEWNAILIVLAKGKEKNIQAVDHPCRLY